MRYRGGGGLAASIADNSSCVRSRRWLRAIKIERVVVASQKLGAGQMDGCRCRCRRRTEANGRRTKGRLAKGDGYSDSATGDQCVGRWWRRMWAATMDSDREVRRGEVGWRSERAGGRGVVWCGAGRCAGVTVDGREVEEGGLRRGRGKQV
jgi:hypothetical protein